MYGDIHKRPLEDAVVLNFVEWKYDDNKGFQFNSYTQETSQDFLLRLVWFRPDNWNHVVQDPY